jgi:hypothetical protein
MDSDRQGLPSASAWRRRELCNGSYQLEAEAERIGQVAGRDSKDSASGTRIHESMVPGALVELSETEAETAQLLRERSNEQIERIFQPYTPEIFREKRLWMQLNKKPALSGRFDLLAYHPTSNPRLALLQDFKAGFTEPEAAEQNSQMKILALLVGLAIPTLEEVIVQIISGPYGVTEARYTMAQLGVVYDETVDLLRRINAPDAPLTPGPEQCKHCTAIMICQAVRDDVVRPMTKLRTSFLPEESERAAKVLDDAEILIKFIKDVKAFYAELLVKNPSLKIPGWEMVPGNVVREVTDWDKARERLAEFLPIDQLNSAADYRLGELEKALGKVLKLKGPPLREKMNSILQGLYVENQNASSLKRVKGKNAAN